MTVSYFEISVCGGLTCRLYYCYPYDLSSSEYSEVGQTGLFHV